MPAVALLTEADIRQSVGLDEEAIRAVEESFTHLTLGHATVPPILILEIPERKGEIDVKSAYIRGLDSFAIKVAAGFFENHRSGLPTSSGMMVILSARTGFVEAVLLDNGYLTDLRTGLAGAVAAKYLARKPIETVGVIGAGTQARYQVRALKLVRSFRKLLVYNRTPESVDKYAREMAAELSVDVVQAKDPAEVVRGADLVVTTTPSRQPLVKVDWLHPGLHITAMGSDGEGKQELHPEVLVRADRLVCDLKAQCFRLGELHHALERGLISREHDITELGELTSGSKPGRRSDQEITVCDLTGVGVQDTAIALLAYRKATEKGLGMRVQT